MGVGNHKNDFRCTATRTRSRSLSSQTTSSCIKLRLPGGLKALFYMTRSSSVSVKRAATKTLLNLAAIDEAKQAVFAGSGIRSLLTLVNVKDEKTKRCAVKVIRRCTELEANRAAFMEPGTLRTIIALLMDTPDHVMRRDLIEIINLLSHANEHKRILMEMGILPALLRHADLTLSTIQMSLQCIECLHLLTSDSPENQVFIVERGAIGTLALRVRGPAAIFHQTQCKRDPVFDCDCGSLASEGADDRIGAEKGAESTPSKEPEDMQSPRDGRSIAPVVSQKYP